MLNQPLAADFTVPAGTPVTAPASQAVPVTGQWIARVRLTIPSGHNGFTGWQLQLAGTVVVPYSGADFVIGSDTELTFDVNRWANPGQLVMLGYNTGTFPHAFHVLIDAYPTEPALPVTAAIDTGTAATAATTAAVAGLEQLAPDEPDSGDEPAAPDAPDLDLSGLEPDLPLEPIDVTAFGPSPLPGGPVPVTAAHPVDRAQLSHAARVSAPRTAAASATTLRPPTRQYVRPPAAAERPPEHKPAERPPARKLPRRGERK